MIGGPNRGTRLRVTRNGMTLNQVGIGMLSVTVNDVLQQLGFVTQDEVETWLDNRASDIVWSLVSIIIIIIVTMIALRLLRTIVRRIVDRVLAQGEQTPRERQQKAQTLADVVESAGRLIVFIIAVMMILTNLGLQIGPLIASAGLAGVALGLGAQNLVRDAFNGFFILFENQYAVGDVIRIQEFSGTVEEVSLRRTVLRSINGAQIVIPNGEIRAVQNLSKGWSRAVIDIETLPTVEDRKVIEVLHDALDDIQSDPEIGTMILEPAQILGVHATTVTGVTFRVLIKTEPLQQWTVERAARLRIRQAFLEHNIPMPILTSATVPSPTATTADASR